MPKDDTPYEFVMSGQADKYRALRHHPYYDSTWFVYKESRAEVLANIQENQLMDRMFYLLRCRPQEEKFNIQRSTSPADSDDLMYYWHSPDGLLLAEFEISCGPLLCGTIATPDGKCGHGKLCWAGSHPPYWVIGRGWETVNPFNINFDDVNNELPYQYNKMTNTLVWNSDKYEKREVAATDSQAGAT